MVSSTYANGYGQVCPPAPRMRTVPLPEILPANPCMPPPPGPAPGARRAHPQGCAVFQGPISPPPSPRPTPGVHFAFSQPLINVLLDPSVHGKPPVLVAHSSMHIGIMASPATYPGMTHIILRFPDLAGRPSIAVRRVDRVTVQDVISAVQRFLLKEAWATSMRRLLNVRKPFTDAFTLRMEWVHDNEFKIDIGI